MDLEMEYIRALFIESQRGYWIHKILHDKFQHDGSCSSAGHCSHELVYNIRFPEPKPNPEPVLGIDYIKDEHGIVTLNCSKALTGDYVHNNIQGLLKDHPDFIAAERGFKLQEHDILEMGFIDLIVKDTRSGIPIKTIVDIKGCGSRTFFYAAGKFKCNPWTYTYWKIKNTKAQSNEYALGCLYYGVLWVNLESWGQFKLEWFRYNHEMHKRVMEKRKNVKEAIKNGTIPKFEGNCYCELGQDGSQCYCRHYKYGTTGDFPEKSGANCPGKTKLQQGLDHVDLYQFVNERLKEK